MFRTVQPSAFATACPAPRIVRLAFSPIGIAGALVLPPVIVGIMDASATRSRSTPWTTCNGPPVCGSTARNRGSGCRHRAQGRSLDAGHGCKSWRSANWSRRSPCRVKAAGVWTWHRHSCLCYTGRNACATKSGSPASSGSTRAEGSSLRRDAGTPPALPAPTTGKSKDIRQIMG